MVNLPLPFLFLLQTDVPFPFIFSLFYLKCVRAHAHTHTHTHTHTQSVYASSLCSHSLLNPADPSAPNVTVTRLTLVCESAPGPITMDLTGKWTHLFCSAGPNGITGKIWPLPLSPQKQTPVRWFLISSLGTGSQVIALRVHNIYRA